MLKRTNYNLLYVEDEDFTRRIAISYLKPYFANIYEAKDGEEALDIFHSKRVDIIMTDIEMPNMNGLEFCKRVREESKDVPIIITTAYTTTEYLLEAVSLNLIKYLVKPMDEDAMFEALNICFEQLEERDPNIIYISSDIKLDKFNKVIIRDDKKVIHLTKYQYKFLEILIKNRGRIVSYDEIENFVWADRYMSSDALRSLVRDVRKIIGKDRIENISKFGYRIKLDG
jgi:DNA-binding response OmpR family regulator